MNATSPIRLSTLSSPPHQVICHCFQITAAEIHHAIRNGAQCVNQVLAATCAGGACRGCGCRIERMLQGLPPNSLSCNACGGSSLVCSCSLAQPPLSPRP